MTEVRVQVFGPLRVVLDGRATRLQAGRQQALLGRLVLAGGTTTRVDRLIEDVWEGSPPAQAASVLQVQVHNLRRILEPARPPRTPACVLVSEDGGYALRLDADSVDSWHFERLLNRYEQHLRQHAGTGPAERYRMLDEALECWHGGAFESFASASWASAEVSRLSDLRATAMEMRARAALEMGLDADVVAALHQLARDNPGREESARLLATAQYRLGQQIDALDTVRRTREHLRSEYGVDPGRPLHELEMAILNHSLEPETPPPGSALVPVSVPRLEKPPSRPACYPAEAGAIHAAAEAAAAGDPRLLWLVGAAGSGKTTLLTGVLGELAARGWHTAFASCPELDGAPEGWVWTELLEGLPGSAEVRAADGVFGVVRAVYRRSRELALHGPVVIALDGAHRADAATLQGIRQLLTWLQGEAVLVVVADRGTEPGRPADLITDRVELTGLDLAGTREFLRNSGVDIGDDALVHSLRERTAGNPMQLRIWSQMIAARPDSGEPPHRIRALILDVAERLPTGSLAVLRALALWGGPIDVDALARLAELTEERVADLLDNAMAASLVRFDGSGRVAVRDELVQRIVRDSIPPMRRRRMHGHMAEFAADRIAGGVLDGAGSAALAVHALHGSTPATAGRVLERLVEAAARCAAAGRRAEAATLWRAAAELNGRAAPVDPDAAPAERAALIDALCLLAEALAHAGDRAAAAAARERALDIAESLADPALVGRALTCWSAPVIPGIRYRGTGSQRLRTALKNALAEPLPGHTRAQLLITLAGEYEGTGTAAQRYAHAGEALALAYHAGDRLLVCAALNAVVCALVDAGSADLCGPATAELSRVAALTESAEYRALALYLRFLDACRRGDLVAAARFALEALAVAADGHFPELHQALLCFVATTDLIRGDRTAAEQHYAACRAAALELGAWHEDALLLTELATAWDRDDLTPLRAVLERRYAQEPERFAHVYALALAQAGELERARPVFRENPPLHRGPGRPLMTVFSARAAVALGESEAAALLFERLTAWSGSTVGLGTGFVGLGPMDLVLARLAAAAGDEVSARTLRDRAGAQREHLRGIAESIRPQTELIAARCTGRPEPGCACPDLHVSIA
ncbi:BTAD domain-containing putative transcriptional regulator [Nocardia asteroides]|uniref:BTAD domain-containing putative transcriptional regulator n=1 Tax=Nocardia asteroides TaxID=1824 RepID=UPI001E4CB62A|nr:BTAD domain-containing putative transcriptional regulator [Nocardia asteroides]UGT61863.1 AAA family ATPase [Nocardia asteroides]